MNHHDPFLLFPARVIRKRPFSPFTFQQSLPLFIQFIPEKTGKLLFSFPNILDLSRPITISLKRCQIILHVIQSQNANTFHVGRHNGIQFGILRKLSLKRNGESGFQPVIMHKTVKTDATRFYFTI